MARMKRAFTRDRSKERSPHRHGAVLPQVHIYESSLWPARGRRRGTHPVGAEVLRPAGAGHCGHIEELTR